MERINGQWPVLLIYLRTILVSRGTASCSTINIAEIPTKAGKHELHVNLSWHTYIGQHHCAQ